MKISLSVLILLANSLCVFAQESGIVINEFLASNVTTNPDIVDFRDFSDWIELYNNQDFDADLSSIDMSERFFLEFTL